MAPRLPFWRWWISRIRLDVAYDGTDFRGWAAQAGQRTVQGTLKEAVRQISGEDCEIVGASRTDSGAHAEGQVCHFDCEAAIPPANWVRALNRVLPPDLRIVGSRKVAETFHSRFCALDRIYRYAFYSGKPDPRAERFAMRVDKPLDFRAMREAGKRLEGEHDFRAFTNELGPDVENTRRKLYKVSVVRKTDFWYLEVRGTAFLKGMMRRMAGALYEVGLGKRKPEEIEALLDPDRRNGLTWPVVLPAKGLTLRKVRYGPHPKDNREKNEDDL